MRCQLMLRGPGLNISPSYNLSRGDTSQFFGMYTKIGDKLGISHEQVDIIVQYLEAEGLVIKRLIDEINILSWYRGEDAALLMTNHDIFAIHRKMLETQNDTNMISITHEGIKEIEKALKHPDKPTKHFSRPSVILNITGGTFNNSPFQVASRNSTQNLTIAPNNLDDIKQILTELKEIQDNPNLRQETKKELVANITILHIQSQAEVPKRERITRALSSIKSILEESPETVSTTATTASLATKLVHC